MTPDLPEQALRAAAQFIKNGIEYGYIQMPDADCPDTAHDTLPLIERAIEALGARSTAAQPGEQPSTMHDTTGTQVLWPQMIAALAAIDAELGLPEDGCNSLTQTLAAIRKLKAAPPAASGDSTPPSAPVQGDPSGALRPEPEAVGQGRWISVDERMPENDDEVLVWIVPTPGRAGYALLDSWHMHREDPNGMGGPTIEMGYIWRDNDPIEVTHWKRVEPPQAASGSTQRARSDDQDRCPKCSGTLSPGIATGQTVYCGDEGTCSPAGPGYVQSCMKCTACGWSRTMTAQDQAAGQGEQP